MKYNYNRLSWVFNSCNGVIKVLKDINKFKADYYCINKLFAFNNI